MPPPRLESSVASPTYGVARLAHAVHGARTGALRAPRSTLRSYGYAAVPRPNPTNGVAASIDPICRTRYTRVRRVVGAGLALVASSFGGRAFAHPCDADAPLDAATAFQASAFGLDALERGRLEDARRCLSRAREGLPTDFAVRRDLALVELRLGHPERARALLDEALALGDPSGRLEAVVVAARLGEPLLAAKEARASGRVEGDLLAAVLEGADLEPRLDHLVRSYPELGPLLRLIMAYRALERGAHGPAQSLSAEAERTAEARGDVEVMTAARRLESERLPGEPWKLGLRLRLLGEHLVNPAFETQSADDGLAFRARGDATLSIALGEVEWWTSVVADLRYLTGELSSMSRMGFSGSTKVSIPLSADLSSTKLELGARVYTVRSDGFVDNLGTGLDAGPNLVAAFGSGWWGELGVFGIWCERGLEADAEDREVRVGQRARVLLGYRELFYVARVALTLVNDETEGQVFDALGAAISGTLEARLAEGLRAELGAALRLQRWGPVGDLAVTGEPDYRRGARTSAHLALTWDLAEHLRGVISDVLVRVDGLGEQGYMYNQASLGLEAGW